MIFFTEKERVFTIGKYHHNHYMYAPFLILLKTLFSILSAISKGTINIINSM